MRKLWLVGLVAASLGLSACGATATLNGAVASLGSSPDLQVHLTGAVSGDVSTAAQPVLSALSIDLNYSNPTGAPLAQSPGSANAEVVVNAGGAALIDIREVGRDVYAMLDVSALANIPSAKLSSAETAALELLVGGRWFEFPASLISSYAPTGDAATMTKERQLSTQILDDLAALIDGTSYTTLSDGGYSQTGSLASVVKAVWPTIASVDPQGTMPSDVPGSYTVTVTTSGTTATGGSVSITAPNGTSGTERATLTATVAHANEAVIAPTGAIVVTRTLLQGLLAQAT